LKTFMSPMELRARCKIW